MDVALTADQRLFAETTRKFLGKSLTARARRELRDDPAGYETSYWKAGAELGWTSLLVGEDLGGGTVSDEGFRDLTLIAYEFGRQAAPGPLLDANIVAGTLSEAGGPTAREAARRIATGDAVAAWCISEPPPHDALGAITATATLSGTDWVLSGDKAPVPYGMQADLCLVTARTDSGRIQLLVPADEPGVTAIPMRTLDVSRRFAHLQFRDVRLPADAAVGKPGVAGEAIDLQLTAALVLQTAEAVGAMDMAFDLTLSWVADRYSFGRPLASYQALKHRLADMKMWLEAGHAVVDAAATAVQHDTPDQAELAAVAKTYVGHYGPELCQECVQLHGGLGLTYEHDLHLYLRRVTVASALLGTVREHRLRLATLIEERDRRERGTA